MTVRPALAAALFAVVSVFGAASCTSDPAPAQEVVTTTEAPSDPTVAAYIRYWKIVHQKDVSPEPPAAVVGDNALRMVRMAYAEAPVQDRACAAGAMMNWFVRGGGRDMSVSRDAAVEAARTAITNSEHIVRFTVGFESGSCGDPSPRLKPWASFPSGSVSTTAVLFEKSQAL